jgi:hypothetical protein
MSKLTRRLEEDVTFEDVEPYLDAGERHELEELRKAGVAVDLGEFTYRMVKQYEWEVLCERAASGAA